MSSTSARGSLCPPTPPLRPNAEGETPARAAHAHTCQASPTLCLQPPHGCHGDREGGNTGKTPLAARPRRPRQEFHSGSSRFPRTAWALGRWRIPLVPWEVKESRMRGPARKESPGERTKHSAHARCVIVGIAWSPWQLRGTPLLHPSQPGIPTALPPPAASAPARPGIPGARAFLQNKRPCLSVPVCVVFILTQCLGMWLSLAVNLDSTLLRSPHSAGARSAVRTRAPAPPAGFPLMSPRGSWCARPSQRRLPSPHGVSSSVWLVEET